MRPLFSHKFNKSLFNQNSKLTIGEVSCILKQTEAPIANAISGITVKVFAAILFYGAVDYIILLEQCLFV